MPSLGRMTRWLAALIRQYWPTKATVQLGVGAGAAASAKTRGSVTRASEGSTGSEPARTADPDEITVSVDPADIAGEVLRQQGATSLALIHLLARTVYACARHFKNGSARR